MSRVDRQHVHRHCKLVDLHAMRRRCRKTFYVFFLNFGQVFYVFYFANVFLNFKKNVGEVQSGKQINKKHFQNNSNEIDL